MQRSQLAERRSASIVSFAGNASPNGFDEVFGLAQELTVRYTEGLESVEGEGRSVLEAQARKRVAVHFLPTRVASWDHSKLGGAY